MWPVEEESERKEKSEREEKMERLRE